MRRLDAALLAAACVLVGASVFFSHGSRDGTVAWVGAGAVVLVAAVGAGMLAGRLPVPELDRPGLLFVGLLFLFVVWSGLTIAWSALPDRSWNYFNRGLAYLAFALVGVAVGALVPRASRLVALGLAGLLGAACFWALAGKVVPALYEDYGRFARLRSPVGYWNALALLGALTLPLGLWLASVRDHARWIRAAGVVLLYVAGITVLLTYSRGGLLAAAFAVIAYLVFTRARVEAIGALAIAAVCAVPALAWGLTQPGVADDFQDRATRVDDGAWFGLIAFLGALAAFALAWLAAPREVPARRERVIVRGALAVGVILALAVTVAALTRSQSDVVQQGPGRSLNTGSNNRNAWWGEAWEAFEGQPLVGVGAGAFESVHRKLRDAKIDVTEPHNLLLQLLAETGLVGTALFVGAIAAALAGLWRRRGDHAALALALMLPAYLIQAFFDYDWDFVAVTAPVLVATGVLLAEGRPQRTISPQPLWAVVTVLAAAAVVVSIAAPRIADRRVEQSYAALDRNEFETAVDRAQQARSLNPLAVSPVLAEAAAEEARGRMLRARRLYVKAVDVQPLNWETWYELGCFELEVLVDLQRAREHLGRALELDPRGPAVRAVIAPATAPGQPPTAQC